MTSMQKHSIRSILETNPVTKRWDTEAEVIQELGHRDYRDAEDQLQDLTLQVKQDQQERDKLKEQVAALRAALGEGASGGLMDPKAKEEDPVPQMMAFMMEQNKQIQKEAIAAQRQMADALASLSSINPDRVVEGR
eukprot:maker-scaffold952_size77175-snap-gene-0.16 protein:Tk01790 transcript:maker-scaffold952_size77175-snap-gene-0.16-mRNA-1 annotation:"fad-binding domain-containing protein"